MASGDRFELQDDLVINDDVGNVLADETAFVGNGQGLLRFKRNATQSQLIPSAAW